MRKNKKICKRLLILGIAIYVIFILLNQQKTLNQYAENSQDLKVKISEQEQYQKELQEQKKDVNSLDFIEKMAREKLDMYYPNERVYVDIGI